jgi:hypothetical protein
MSFLSSVFDTALNPPILSLACARGYKLHKFCMQNKILQATNNPTLHFTMFQSHNFSQAQQRNLSATHRL